jgi:hypothetical protein
MLELQKSIGFIHVMLSFIISIYFIWAPAQFDTYYLFYFLLLTISWSLMKNECAISYFFKYIGDPNYKMGDTTDVEDYNAIFGASFSELGPIITTIFLNYVLFMYVVNLCFIASRFKGNQNKLAVLVTAISYCLYIIMLRTAKKEQKDTLQTANLLINSILLGYFLYK